MAVSGFSSSGPPGGFPLGYLLRQAAAAHRLRMDKALADIEVTPPQFFTMTCLAQAPRASSADLARMAAQSTATISVIIANLERRGAIQRAPHPVNGRTQILDLTPSGEALLAACRARAVAVESELEADVTPAERNVLSVWLSRAAKQGGQK